MFCVFKKAARILRQHLFLVSTPQPPAVTCSFKRERRIHTIEQEQTQNNIYVILLAVVYSYSLASLCIYYIYIYVYKEPPYFWNSFFFPDGWGLFSLQHTAPVFFIVYCWCGILHKSRLLFIDVVVNTPQPNRICMRYSVCSTVSSQTQHSKSHPTQHTHKIYKKGPAITSKSTTFWCVCVCVSLTLTFWKPSRSLFKKIIILI